MFEFYYEARRLMENLEGSRAAYETDNEQEEAAEVQAALDAVQRAYDMMKALQAKGIY